MPVHVIITRTRQQMDNFRTLLDSAGVYVEFPEHDMPPSMANHPKAACLCDVCGVSAKSRSGLAAHKRKHKK